MNSVPAVVVHVQQVVQAYDGQTCRRQQKEQKEVGLPEAGGPGQTAGEGRAHRTCHRPYQQGEQNPFEKGGQIPAEPPPKLGELAGEQHENHLEGERNRSHQNKIIVA